MSEPSITFVMDEKNQPIVGMRVHWDTQAASTEDLAKYLVDHESCCDGYEAAVKEYGAAFADSMRQEAIRKLRITGIRMDYLAFAVAEQLSNWHEEVSLINPKAFWDDTEYFYIVYRDKDASRLRLKVCVPVSERFPTENWDYFVMGEYRGVVIFDGLASDFDYKEMAEKDELIDLKYKKLDVA